MKFILAALLVAALALPGIGLAHAATPAHYIVFEIDADGGVRPIHYTRVELQAMTADLPGADTAAITPTRDEVGYRLYRAGVAVGVRKARVPRLHGEFARDPGRDGTIVATRPADAPRSFVVRVPLDAADAIEFGEAANRQRFDFATLARAATALPQALTPRLASLGGGGPPANRVDILVLAEGYTGAQQGLFDADAEILRNAFFGLTPYADYPNFINWTTAFVSSGQSGADHPPYLANCGNASCCADPAAQSDPFAGTFVDTAFDGKFCDWQIHRLLTVDYNKALAAAAVYPDWDEIIVVVNDPVYGGSGGAVAALSTHPYADQVVLHEYGHTFTSLADEYDSPYPGFPPCSDVSGSQPCEANVTDVSVPGQIKWKDWLTPGNPIPTPPGMSGVGLFEGARYLSQGMYRPVDAECLMRNLLQPFCPVCSEEYVLALYRGGWGVPFNGIDVIEPGSESPPVGQPVPYVPGTMLNFSVALLGPPGGSFDIQWLLDGQPVPGDAQYAFWQGGATPATRTLELRVRGLSDLVSASRIGELPLRTRSWTIEVVGERIFQNGFD